MAEVIKMPRMSDTMEEGVINEWHKNVGDSVKIGDLLAEIETDKATMDFESPVEGTILHIGPKKGDTVPIDGILAIIGEKGEDFEKLLKGAATDKKETEEEPQEDKEQTKESTNQKHEEEDTDKESQPDKKSSPETKSSVGDGERIKASPLAKKLAKEKGIDIGDIRGTGDEGRIIKRDIEAFQPDGREKTEYPVAVREESYEEIPLSQVRKTIAKRLSASKFSAPHFYLTIEINMDQAMEARKVMNEFSPVKISFNDLIIKAAASALREHHQVNASWQDDKIRINHHIHIGMAVAIDEGLKVPVIRFADGKTLAQLAAEAKELAAKTKEGKLKIDEMQGNTFTISNLGMFDIDEFTAIINSPEACILAVGTIKQAAVVIDENITIANIMKVTLSCDHRVVDGATGARFLQTFKALMENPVRMLV